MTIDQGGADPRQTAADYLASMTTAEFEAFTTEVRSTGSIREQDVAATEAEYRRYYPTTPARG